MPKRQQREETPSNDEKSSGRRVVVFSVLERESENRFSLDVSQRKTLCSTPEPAVDIPMTHKKKREKKRRKTSKLKMCLLRSMAATDLTYRIHFQLKQTQKKKHVSDWWLKATLRGGDLMWQHLHTPVPLETNKLTNKQTNQKSKNKAWQTKQTCIMFCAFSFALSCKPVFFISHVTLSVKQRNRAKRHQ